MIFTFLFVFGAAAGALIAYFKWMHGYWERRGIPTLGTATIPFGDIPSPMKRKETIGLVFKKIHLHLHKQGHKHAGLYLMHNPMYFVMDLDYLKNVLTKDFQHFSSRGAYHNERDDPISAHLFAIGGPKWKNLRTKLTPTFTSGKMKMMFPTLLECVPPMIKAVEKHRTDDTPVNIKEVLSCFTTNIIGNVAFGLECNTFEDPNSPFRVHTKNVFRASKWKQVKFAFASNSKWGQSLGIKVFEKDVSQFFFDVVTKTVNYRLENNVKRPDFMQLLIELKAENEEMAKHDGKSLTMNEIVAQAFIFFFAGFETSSTTSTFALYEMARNQDVQDKVRMEVAQVLKKYGGEITYESLAEMKYMQQVIDETLRKYPPVPFLTRECVKDYKVPDCDVTIEKGTRVGFSVMGIHYDPELWSEPDKFDPERFSDENRQGRHQYAHIPFGEGPRICIGLRFGIMQTKVGLAQLLSNFRFRISERTQVPLDFDIGSFILSAKGDVWLDVEKVA